MNWKRWKPYLIALLLTEGVGGLSGFLIRDGIKRYTAEVQKPPLSPPPLVFPIVWAVLYALMAIGAARVWLTPDSRSRSAGLRLFVIQLAFNFGWSLIFFNLQRYGFAFFWLAALWGLIVWMTLTFYETDRPAALMQIPYLLWVLFAGYLNLGVWNLNQ